MATRRVLISLLVTPLGGDAPRAGTVSPPAPLDLAALLPTPADLAAAGLERLVSKASRALRVVDLADRAVWPAGAGQERNAVADALVAAGWRQGYATWYASQPETDGSGLSRECELELVAYADARGAVSGFRLVPYAYPTGPITTVAEVTPIGDEARAVRVAARDPQAGIPSRELALGFRVGRLTGRVLIRDWSGKAPPLALGEMLSARLLSGIERVLTDPALPGDPA